MKDLKDKRCLLTGAASGIGRAMALELAREGVHLYLLDVDLAGLQMTIEHLGELVLPVTRLSLARNALGSTSHLISESSRNGRPSLSKKTCIRP